LLAEREVTGAALVQTAGAEAAQVVLMAPAITVQTSRLPPEVLAMPDRVVEAGRLIVVVATARSGILHTVLEAALVGVPVQ